MFYIEEGKDLTFSDVKYYISKFVTGVLPRLSRLQRYYQNKNDTINNRQFCDESKPNNKVVHSFAHYITTTNTTMFLGSPISYTSSDNLEDYNTVLEEADEQDININLAVNCSKFGYGIQLLYLDENANVRFAVLDNRQTILIYSDEIGGKLLYCIRFWKTETVDHHEDSYVELYTKDSVVRYKNDLLQSQNRHPFSTTPVVVYFNNSDLTGDYENVISLIDAYDLLESDSINENDYFNNAYLYLNTDGIDMEAIKSMKENRIIYGEELTPSFILKSSQNADNDIEKNRLVSDIHKLSFTPDMSDNNFANNVSGVAMKYKLLGTLNNIANKQRKFKKAIEERNKLLFEIMTIKSMFPPSYVDVIFTTSLPENMLETAQTINQLRGLVSDETLVSLLPFVQDAAWEVEQAMATRKVGDIYDDEEQIV